MTADLSPALAGSLLVVAHSDDDGLGLGVALRGHHPAAIVYLTDSAPRDAR